jgi:lipid-A-disaccharide synthase-like uncharacterized protein
MSFTTKQNWYISLLNSHICAVYNLLKRRNVHKVVFDVNSIDMGKVKNRWRMYQYEKCGAA